MASPAESMNEQGDEPPVAVEPLASASMMQEVPGSDCTRSDETPFDHTRFRVTGSVSAGAPGQVTVVVPDVGCHVPVNLLISASLPPPWPHAVSVRPKVA